MPLEGLAISYPAMHSLVSFRYFKTSPEIIQLAVMLYVRFPLSLRNVEDLLHERGVDVSYESVRYWWHRFGFKFASEIEKLLCAAKDRFWDRLVSFCRKVSRLDCRATRSSQPPSPSILNEAARFRNSTEKWCINWS